MYIQTDVILKLKKKHWNLKKGEKVPATDK